MSNTERWAAGNLCASCGHPKDDHLESSDQGWCTLPAGTCIFNPCGCKGFVEPKSPSGRRFVVADYSEIERRILARYLNDFNARGDF